MIARLFLALVTVIAQRDVLHALLDETKENVKNMTLAYEMVR